MECPKCEVNIKDGARFCEYCGHHFSGNNSIPKAEPIEVEKAKSQTSLTSVDIKVAPINKRFQNYLIDKIILYILGEIYFLLFPIDIDTINQNEMSLSHPDIQFMILSLAGVSIAYFILMEYFFNQTIGKMVTKTFVCTINGTKPSFIQILIRTCMRMLPLYELTILLNQISRKQPLSIHDHISKAYVISHDK